MEKKLRRIAKDIIKLAERWEAETKVKNIDELYMIGDRIHRLKEALLKS